MYVAGKRGYRDFTDAEILARYADELRSQFHRKMAPERPLGFNRKFELVDEEAFIAHIECILVAQRLSESRPKRLQ